MVGTRAVAEPRAGSLDPAGPVAAAAADVWWLMLGLGAFAFTVFAVALAVGLRRHTPSAEPSPPGSDGRERTSRWIIGGGVILPLVVVLVVFAATVDALREMPTEAPEGALVVEVTGHQWWWEVRYPDAGFTTANEVHLPVGRDVAFRLTSADVIHSFWVPALAGKMDLLPDGTNVLVLRADEAGTYPSRCAEFCGLQHAAMELTVVAEPEADFDEWVATRRRPGAEPAGTAAVRGREVFLDSACASCHTIAGTSEADAADEDAVEGPVLTHLADRPTLGAGAVDNTPGELAAWITDPHAVKSGVAMPAAELTHADRADLLAYLAELR